MFRVIEQKKISTGIRLKELIEETGLSQRDFINTFSQWKDKQEQYQNIKYPTERDISRWINEKVMMRKQKIDMFADYFNVDYDYLACNQVERLSLVPNKPRQTLAEVERIERIRQQRRAKVGENKLNAPIQNKKSPHELIKELLISKEYNVTELLLGEDSDSMIVQEIKDGYLYTLEHIFSFPTDMQIQIDYPDGSVHKLSYNEFENLLSDISEYVDLKMKQTKK